MAVGSYLCPREPSERRYSGHVQHGREPYRRFPPQDLAAIAAKILNVVWEAA
jgi:hypothetical protein